MNPPGAGESVPDWFINLVCFSGSGVSENDAKLSYKLLFDPNSVTRYDLTQFELVPRQAALEILEKAGVKGIEQRERALVDEAFLRLWRDLVRREYFYGDEQTYLKYLKKLWYLWDHEFRVSTEDIESTEAAFRRQFPRLEFAKFDRACPPILPPAAFESFERRRSHLLDGEGNYRVLRNYASKELLSSTRSYSDFRPGADGVLPPLILLEKLDFREVMARAPAPRSWDVFRIEEDVFYSKKMIQNRLLDASRSLNEYTTFLAQISARIERGEDVGPAGNWVPELLALHPEAAEHPTESHLRFTYKKVILEHIILRRRWFNQEAGRPPEEGLQPFYEEFRSLLLMREREFVYWQLTWRKHWRDAGLPPPEYIQSLLLRFFEYYASKCIEKLFRSPIWQEKQVGEKAVTVHKALRKEEHEVAALFGAKIR